MTAAPSAGSWTTLGRWLETRKLNKHRGLTCRARGKRHYLQVNIKHAQVTRIRQSPFYIVSTVVCQLEMMLHWSHEEDISLKRIPHFSDRASTLMSRYWRWHDDDGSTKIYFKKELGATIILFKLNERRSKLLAFMNFESPTAAWCERLDYKIRRLLFKKRSVLMARWHNQSCLTKSLYLQRMPVPAPPLKKIRSVSHLTCLTPVWCFQIHLEISRTRGCYCSFEVTVRDVEVTWMPSRTHGVCRPDDVMGTSDVTIVTFDTPRL